MAWFTKNKYASHPDILDMIAKRGAEIALSQIKADINFTKKPCTYCEIKFRTLNFNDKPLETHWGSPCGCQELAFSDFNMDGIPCDDEILFLSALLPYLQKHLDENLKKFFPSVTKVTATKTAYVDFKYTVNAIQIDVTGIPCPSSKPILNKW